MRALDRGINACCKKVTYELEFDFEFFIFQTCVFEHLVEVLCRFKYKLLICDPCLDIVRNVVAKVEVLVWPRTMLLMMLVLLVCLMVVLGSSSLDKNFGKLNTTQKIRISGCVYFCV